MTTNWWTIIDQVKKFTTYFVSDKDMLRSSNITLDAQRLCP